MRTIHNVNGTAAATSSNEGVASAILPMVKLTKDTTDDERLQTEVHKSRLLRIPLGESENSMSLGSLTV